MALDDLRARLERADLIPSHRATLEGFQENFAALMKTGRNTKGAFSSPDA
jgi:hypothetical protein